MATRVSTFNKTVPEAAEAQVFLLGGESSVDGKPVMVKVDALGQILTTLAAGGTYVKADGLPVEVQTDNAAPANDVPMPVRERPATGVFTTMRIVHASTPIGAGWVTLVASTPAGITHIDVWDSSGETLELGIGPVAGEVRLCLVPPGGGSYAVTIATGTRISVRAVSAMTATGELILNAK